jgi:acyl-ACP thioesterase
MEKIGSYTFTIQPYQVDFQQKVTLMGLGYYLLESAGLHADERAFGLRDLLKMRKAWFLTRFSIQMEDYPLQYQQIRIETWVQDVGDVFTSRNFHILNEKGERIGSAGSSWAMIDLRTRKPVFLKEYLSDAHVESGREGAFKTEKVPPLHPEAPVWKRYQVTYSDLDIMRHVNSIRYIQWVLDLFPLDLFERRSVRRIDINYMAETVFGDEVAFRKEEREPGADYLVEVIREKDQSPVCRVRVRWA